MTGDHPAPDSAGGPDSVPRLLPHALLREDKVRGGWVVMGPERAWFFNATGAEIIKRIDGRRKVSDIAQELAAIYEAGLEAIVPDVLEVIETLRSKGLAAW